MTPTQRTLRELKRLGYLAWKAERWNSFAKVSQDAFGFADILAVGSLVRGTLYVQCTSGSNHSARVLKIRDSKNAEWVWLCGNKVEIWSWSKKGPRGKAKKWELRREEVTWW